MPPKTKITQTARILKAKKAIDREQELIKMTIGNAVGLLMNPATKVSVDMASIYSGLGGKSEFTTQLLAQTFGSRSLRKKGDYPLEPGVAPDFAKLQSALVSRSKTLAEKGLAGVGGLAPTIIEAPVGKSYAAATVWTFSVPAGDTAGGKEHASLARLVTVRASCNGGGGGTSGW